MHQIFTSRETISEIISCPRCQWSGKADETEQEHLFLTDAIELYCPECEGYIGFISPDEEEKQEQSRL